jgi:pantoate--beta-alanine ligase
MELFGTASEIREWSRARKRSGKSVGFVPTMGALHAGHASLLREAKNRSDSVVLSIFVNPTQFGPNEDFSKYPRTWDADLETAQREGVEAVFAPGADFYPDGYRTVVHVADWNSLLEGQIRPVHFDGVTSVVAKLFHSVEPDVAVFGQKDAQQALLIRRMVRDLDFGLRLVVAPTVRESDGLALSSRNRYLSPTDRGRAVLLSQALAKAAAVWDHGCRNPSEILATGREELVRDPPDSVDYFTLLDPDTLRVLDGETNWNAPALLVIAARYGHTRLIDNTALGEVW